MKTIEEITNSNGTRRVEIFQRDDGTFGFADWKYGEAENAWFLARRYSECFADSRETALREAYERVGWLAAAGRNC